jgi:hypothetical protein
VKSYWRRTPRSRVLRPAGLREPGSYPGKDIFEQLASLMNVFTVLALLSALVLIANTMTHADRRAAPRDRNDEGDRRHRRSSSPRSISERASSRRVGSIVGAGLGVLIANAIVRYFGESFFAISPGFGVVVPVVVASVLLGLAAPPLAALPAIRSGARIPVREGLEEVPALEGSQAFVDRALRRLDFLPRTAQIGIRSITRRCSAQSHDGRPDRARRSARCSPCSRS